jgi:hypothetical protein
MLTRRDAEMEGARDAGNRRRAVFTETDPAQRVRLLPEDLDVERVDARSGRIRDAEPHRSRRPQRQHDVACAPHQVADAARTRFELQGGRRQRPGTWGWAVRDERSVRVDLGDVRVRLRGSDARGLIHHHVAIRRAIRALHHAFDRVFARIWLEHEDEVQPLGTGRELDPLARHTASVRRRCPDEARARRNRVEAECAALVGTCHRQRARGPEQPEVAGRPRAVGRRIDADDRIGDGRAVLVAHDSRDDARTGQDAISELDVVPGRDTDGLAPTRVARALALEHDRARTVGAGLNPWFVDRSRRDPREHAVGVGRARACVHGCRADAHGGFQRHGAQQRMDPAHGRSGDGRSSRVDEPTADAGRGAGGARRLGRDRRQRSLGGGRNPRRRDRVIRRVGGRRGRFLSDFDRWRRDRFVPVGDPPRGEPHHAHRDRCFPCRRHDQRSDCAARRAGRRGRRRDARETRDSGESSCPSRAALEVLAQTSASTLQPRADGVDRDLLPARGLDWGQTLEMHEQDGSAVRLIEREHGLDDAAAELFAFEDVVRGRRRLSRRRVPQQPLPSRTRAQQTEGRSPRDGGEPRRERRRHGRRPRQGDAIRLLHHVVDVGVVTQDAARDRAHEGVVRQQQIQIELHHRHRNAPDP